MSDISLPKNAKKDYRRAFRTLLDHPLVWLLLAGLGLALAGLATVFLCRGGYCGLSA